MLSKKSHLELSKWSGLLLYVQLLQPQQRLFRLTFSKEMQDISSTSHFFTGKTL